MATDPIRMCELFVGLLDVNMRGVDGVTGGCVVVDDPERVGDVRALGLGEIHVVRIGKWKMKEFSTPIVNVEDDRRLDVVPGGGDASPIGWPERHP